LRAARFNVGGGVPASVRQRAAYWEGGGFPDARPSWAHAHDCPLHLVRAELRHALDAGRDYRRRVLELSSRLHRHRAPDPERQPHRALRAPSRGRSSIAKLKGEKVW